MFKAARRAGWASGGKGAENGAPGPPSVTYVVRNNRTHREYPNCVSNVVPPQQVLYYNRRHFNLDRPDTSRCSPKAALYFT